MNKSERIRQLAAEGLTTAEIAKQVGVRYQHAYNVLKQAKQLSTTSRTSRSEKERVGKPKLELNHLLNHGFKLVSRWQADGRGGIQPATPLPKDVGVYAFSVDGEVQYVGVATMGLAKRLYLYGRPGPTQTTSIRLNRLINALVVRNTDVQIAVALPNDLDWNGLPVHGAAGLELGLIKTFDLPWNKRSSN